MIHLELSRSKITQTFLLLISAISLTIYFLPTYDPPPIFMGTKWNYYYKERLVASDEKILYEVEEELNYSVIDKRGDILIVELNRTFRQTYFSPNGSKSLVLNGSNIQIFFIDIQSRRYQDGTYTSWWIPRNVFIGSLVPIWSLDFYVAGLSWTIINGRLIECWVLKYEGMESEYTLLYERYSGLFVRFDIRRRVGSSQMLSAERWLKDINMDWPLQAVIRPFLIVIGISSIVTLICHYARKIRKYFRRPREEQSPIFI